MTPLFSATWICVRCGWRNRCEVRQWSDETDVNQCPPLGCLQGLVVPGTQDDRAEWELVE